MPGGSTNFKTLSCQQTEGASLNRIREEERERWDKYAGASKDLTSDFLEEDEFWGGIFSLWLGSLLSVPFPRYFSCPLFLLGFSKVLKSELGAISIQGRSLPCKEQWCCWYSFLLLRTLSFSLKHLTRSYFRLTVGLVVNFSGHFSFLSHLAHTSSHHTGPHFCLNKWGMFLLQSLHLLFSLSGMFFLLKYFHSILLLATQSRLIVTCFPWTCFRGGTSTFNTV